MKISTFTYKGIDIELTFNKGSLAYVFTKDGERYGLSLKVPSKSAIDIASTAFLLFINASESLEALQTHDK